LSLGVAEQVARSGIDESVIRMRQGRDIAPPLGPGGAGPPDPAGFGGSPCRGPPTYLDHCFPDF